MFKKILLAMLCVPFLSALSFCQNVTCSGQIQDSLGNYYVYGTYSLVFVPGPNVNVGTGASTATQSGTLSSTGSFSGVTLGDLTVLGGGSMWKATICNQQGSCFTKMLTSAYVYGTSASLSTVLSNAAPLISGLPSGYTFGAATGSGVNMFTLVDSASNTGTGSVLSVQTASSSAASPLTATAQGTSNGVQLNTAGVLAKIGSGSVKADNSTAPTDGYYMVPLGACGMTLTTGALGTSTTGANPGIVNVATGEGVLQAISSSAASAMTFDCDITPPSRLTSGKGLTLTGVRVFYGYQGAAALSSITGPAINTVTFSAAGGAAAGTVASAGGVLTTTAGTSHASPGAATTTGQCYSELSTFGTAITINSDLVRVTLEEVFNHTTASAATYQVCGIAIDFSNQVL